MIIYAAGFSIIKEVTPGYVSPAGFVAIRVIGATPLLWLTGLFIREKVSFTDLKKNYGVVAIWRLHQSIAFY